jgi:hypothetical protein
MVPRTRSVETVPECTTRTAEMLHTYGTWRCPDRTRSTSSSRMIAITSRGDPQVVDVTAGAGDSRDVMVNDHDPGPLRPPTGLGVEPAVVLAPDLTLVEVRFGGVDRDHLRTTLADRNDPG